MKHIYALIILFACAFRVQAQTSFKKTLIDDRPVSNGCMIKTDDGGTLLMGYTYAPTNDIIVTKLSSLYAVEWTKKFDFGKNEVGNCIIQTKDKGIVIAGYSYDNVLLPDSLFTMIVFKLTNTGTLLWSKKIKTSGNAVAASIVETKIKTLLVAGTITPKNSTSGAISLISLDAVGNLLSTKKFTTGADMDIFKIMPDYSGGFMICGVYYNFSSSSPFLMNINSAGIIKWNKYYRTSTSSSDGRFFSMSKTADKGYVMTGDYSVNITRGRDLFILKTDSLGNVKWNGLFGSTNADWGNAIIESSDQGIVVTGTGSMQGNAQASKLYTVKVDKNGTLMWSRLAYEGLNRGEGMAVAEDNDKSYLVFGLNDLSQDATGYFLKYKKNGIICNSPDTLANKRTTALTTSTLVFGSATDGTVVDNPARISAGTQVIDVCQDAFASTTATGSVNMAIAATATTKLTTRLLANPVSDKIMLAVASPASEKLVINVFDNEGRSVINKSMMVSKGQSTVILPANDLAKGVYYINIVSRQGKEVLKMIKD